MAEWTEGVCDDGAAILRDGEPVKISDLLAHLNTEQAEATARQKVSHIGAPAVFALEQACKQLREAFPETTDDAHIGIYIVGSSLERPDWRDVDVRMMMDDASFAREFPGVNLQAGTWEFDPRWCLLVVSISQWMSKLTGLPIDFQFQPMTHANARHKGRRHAMGLTFAKD